MVCNSLKTTHYSVAQTELAEFLKEHRRLNSIRGCRAWSFPSMLLSLPRLVSIRRRMAAIRTNGTRTGMRLSLNFATLPRR